MEMDKDKVVNEDLEENVPTLDEWLEGWEAESDEGRRLTISKEEAIKRYRQTYPERQPDD